MKSENKKLKTTFFTLLIISLIVFVVILFTDNSNYKAILDNNPKVDHTIFKEWGERAYSLDEIGE